MDRVSDSPSGYRAIARFNSAQIANVQFGESGQIQQSEFPIFSKSSQNRAVLFGHDLPEFACAVGVPRFSHFPCCGRNRARPADLASEDLDLRGVAMQRNKTPQRNVPCIEPYLQPSEVRKKIAIPKLFSMRVGKLQHRSFNRTGGHGERGHIKPA
jgi:hypothetical protein